MRCYQIVLLVLATLSFAACDDADTPEAQVRKSVAAMEQAAEERDVDDLMDWVSPEFRAANGQGSDELRRYIYGFFIANQSIHLLTRINSLEFPAPDEARLNVTVGMVSREAESASAWNLAAEMHEFDVTLRRADDDWKVIYAQRKPR
jgi:hypothetical protein